MKGISAIIATILLLIMTIALAGTAYIFVSGLLTAKMAKTISILGATCNGTHIALVVSNDGTDRIEANEIRVFVNDREAGPFGVAIDPRSSEVNSTISAHVVQGSSNRVMLVSPSNTVDITLWCSSV